jgi:hypothetical protein
MLSAVLPRTHPHHAKPRIVIPNAPTTIPQKAGLHHGGTFITHLLSLLLAPPMTVLLRALLSYHRTLMNTMYDHMKFFHSAGRISSVYAKRSVRPPSPSQIQPRLDALGRNLVSTCHLNVPQALQVTFRREHRMSQEIADTSVILIVEVDEASNQIEQVRADDLPF